MNRNEVLQLFDETDALLRGHFLLSSGLHSEQYLQCAKVQQYPDMLEKCCRALAAKWSDREVTVVMGPAMGGIVLAYELARHLHARGLFMERGSGGEFEVRRGFELRPDDRVLIAEDVVTTGRSVREVIENVKETDAELVGVTSLVCRNTIVDFGTEYRYLVEADFPIWSAEECPLCRKGIPVTKPGSRPGRGS